MSEHKSIEALADALPREIKRVREEIMPAYEDIGEPGMFALTMMRSNIERAERAIFDGDVVEMLRCFESLKGYRK